MEQPEGDQHQRSPYLLIVMTTFPGRHQVSTSPRPELGKPDEAVVRTAIRIDSTVLALGCWWRSGA